MRMFIFLFGFVFCVHFGYAQERDVELGKRLLDSTDVLIDKRQYEEALIIGEEALNILKKTFGEQSSLTAKAYYRLGSVLSEKGILDEALKYNLKALEIRLVVLGEGHPDVVQSYNKVGNIYSDQSQYELALNYYQRAIDILKKKRGEEDSKVADIYFNVGNLYYNQVEFELALSYYQKAIDILKKTKSEENSQVADIYYNIGNLYNYQSEFDLALSYYQKALVGYKKTLGEEHPKVANTSSNIGSIYNDQGKYELALTYYQKALAIREKRKGEKHLEIAINYRIIGIVYKNQSKYQLALSYYQKALDIIIKEIGEESIQAAYIYNSIGVVYWNQGKYDLALSYYQKSLDIRKKTLGEEHHRIALVYNNMGIIYRTQGKYELALIHYQKALAIRKKTLGEEHPLVADTYNNIGVSYEKQGAYKLALSNHQKALTIRKKKFGKEHPDVADSYNNIGAIYNEQDKYDLALSYFQKALSIRRKMLGEEHPLVASVYSNMGYAYFNHARYELASYHFQKSLTILKKTRGGRHPLVADMHNNIGMVYAKQGSYKLDLNHLQKALEVIVDGFTTFDIYQNPLLSNQMSSKPILLRTLKRKAETFYRLYTHESQNQIDLRAALEVCQLAVDLIDEMNKNYNWGSSKEALSKNAFPVYELYIKVTKELYRLTHEDFFLQQAFLALEKSKSVLLLEAIRESRAKSFHGLPDSLLDKEYNINTDIAFYEKQLFEEECKKEEADSSIIELGRDKLFYLKQSRDSLLVKYQNGYPSYYQLKHELTTTNISKIQTRLLQPNQALLEYFVGDSAVFVFVVQKDDLKVAEIKLDFPLKEWVQGLREGIYQYHITEPKSDSLYQETMCQFIENAQFLYHKLLAPLGKLPEKLIIIPDGLLWYVPFEILLTEQPAEDHRAKRFPYLIKEHQIAYNYSATLWQEMLDKKHRRPQKRGVLAFAPSFGQLDEQFVNIDDFRRNNLAHLNYNDLEAEAIHRQWEGNIYIGPDATRNNFFTQASRYPILHLATHAKVNDQQVDYSFLAFYQEDDSTESKVYISDLYNMHLPVDMAVLSACETGIGKLQKGEGVISLARGFAYAGAKSIITSLWSVNDQSTYHIMERFYRNLHSGMEKNEALRVAKLDYLQQSDQMTGHPYYWAGFVAIGDMTPINKPRHYRWLIGFGLLGLIGLIWRFRNKK